MGGNASELPACTVVLVSRLVCFAEPKVDVAVIQKGQTEGHRQQIEKVVITGQNDEHLKKQLHREQKQSNLQTKRSF